MCKKWISIVYLLAAAGMLYAQQTDRLKRADSLANVLEQKPATVAEMKRQMDAADSLPDAMADDAILICQWIERSAPSQKAWELQMRAQIVLGRIYAMQLNFEDATTFYNKAIQIGERYQLYQHLVTAWLGLGKAQRFMNFKKEGIGSVKTALAIAEKNNYALGIGMAKVDLGMALADNGFPLRKDTFQLRIHLLKTGIAILKAGGHSAQLGGANLNLAERYSGYNYFDSALAVISETKPFFEAKENEKFLQQYHFIHGVILYRKASKQGSKADFAKALVLFEKVKEIASAAKNNTYLLQAYDWISFTNGELGNYKAAYENAIEYTKLADETGDEKRMKAVADIQHLYDRQKRENEILKLKGEKEKYSLMWKVLAGFSLLLVALIFLIGSNFKNRSKIATQLAQMQKQKISELEKDKQLMTVNAMLQGQEEERKRIAKDLHDGLGGLLSGTKMSFVNIKEQSVLPPAQVEQFNKSLEMLDKTIVDLRNIAHNLMPEALVKFGLTDALEDFCDNVTVTSRQKVQFQYLGEPRTLSNMATLSIYRIVQELVNNAIKYAAASEILVQISFEADKILISVDDNGKGFDMEAITAKSGAGIANIKARVSYLGGQLELQSQIAQGTSANIVLYI
jgi:two-component system, NarL family, sensor kinase